MSYEEQQVSNEPFQPKKKKGCGPVGWILGGCGCLVLIGVVVVGLGVWWMANAISMDPAEVEGVAHEILPFEKPEEIKGIFSISISLFGQGFKMAVLGDDPDNEKSAPGQVIMLMHGPQGQISKEDMQQQYRDNTSENTDLGTPAETRSETFVLRGNEIQAEMQIFQPEVEASGEETETKEAEEAPRMVQYFMEIPGSPNHTILMISGPEKIWSPDRVQALLDTVK